MITGAWAANLLLGGIILLGSSVQWLTGMGFALVAVPALVLLLGPAEGVALANCAAGVICLVGLTDGWARVRLRAMVPLCAAAACTVPAGTWVARRLPEPVLLAFTGSLVTVAVLLVMRGDRVPALRGTGGAVTAGALGGFMNSAAGVGGPPVSLYAVNAGWPVRESRTRSSTECWSTRSPSPGTGCPNSVRLYGCWPRPAWLPEPPWGRRWRLGFRRSGLGGWCCCWRWGHAQLIDIRRRIARPPVRPPRPSGPRIRWSR